MNAKFELNQYVYFMADNKPHIAKILGMMEITGLFPDCRYCSPTPGIKYFINKKNSILSEEELFSTLEELLKYLETNVS